ncbi:hypothetical protein [Micromonospora sp. NPDC005172]|uniref:hypothetical protein n=1 Tax=Micromonospora sp. NPDC005172 TaxID=3156867 RepID=UPI0033A1073F
MSGLPGQDQAVAAACEGGVYVLADLLVAGVVGDQAAEHHRGDRPGLGGVGVVGQREPGVVNVQATL